MERLSLLSNHFAAQHLKFCSNNFAHVTEAPPDGILSLSVDFKNDKDPKKVNLGVGAYRDDKGKPFVFPIVKKIELEIINDPSDDHEYAP